MSFLNSLPQATAQGLIWGLLALGVAVTYQVMDYADLTVDGSFATGGAVCAVSIAAGLPAAAALGVAVLAGMATGYVTGILHTSFKIPGILAGILSQLALYSINMRIMGRSNLTISRTQYNLLLSSADVKGALLTAALICLAVITALVWFFKTEVGFALRATGNNEAMAKAQGINIDAMKRLGLVISNGLIGLSGGLLAQYQGNADINMGRGAIVIGLAAVIIGSRLMFLADSFLWRFAATVFGSIVYFSVLSMVMYLGLSTVDLKLFTAAFVALFLSLPKGLVKKEMV
ncbi:MAG: ABC transporter permease [Firmicutes bacterium]|nr:ABC transporter permease [Bacillota bacterium]